MKAELKRINVLKQINPYCLATAELAEYVTLSQKHRRPREAMLPYEKEYAFRQRWSNYPDPAGQSPDQAQQHGQAFWQVESDYPDVRLPVTIDKRGGLIPIYITNAMVGQEIGIVDVLDVVKAAMVWVRKESLTLYDPKLVSTLVATPIIGASARFLLYMAIILKGLYHQRVSPWITASADCDVHTGTLSAVDGIEYKVKAAEEQGICIFCVHPDNRAEAEAAANTLCVETLPTTLAEAQTRFMKLVMERALGEACSDVGRFHWLLQRHDVYKQERAPAAEPFFLEQLQLLGSESPLARFLTLSALAGFYSSQGRTAAARHYLEEVVQHRDQFPQAFAPTAGLQYWGEAYVKLPLQQAINAIDYLEYITSDRALDFCEQSRANIEWMLRYESPDSYLQYYHFMALNTQARVLNYRCRIGAGTDWQAVLDLLLHYPPEKWYAWAELKMPEASVNRQRNTILEFATAWKTQRMLNRQSSEDIERQVAVYAYSLADLKELAQAGGRCFDFDLVCGALWLASLGQNVLGLCQGDLAERFHYPLGNLQIVWAEQLWQEGRQDQAIARWERVIDEYGRAQESVLPILALRAVFTWAKCCRQNNRDAGEPLQRLGRIYENCWPVIQPHWKTFCPELTADADAGEFAAAAARVPY